MVYYSDTLPPFSKNECRIAAAFNLVAKLPSARGVFLSIPSSDPYSLAMYSSDTSSIPLNVGAIHFCLLLSFSYMNTVTVGVGDVDSDISDLEPLLDLFDLSLLRSSINLSMSKISSSIEDELQSNSMLRIPGLVLVTVDSVADGCST